MINIKFLISFNNQYTSLPPDTYNEMIKHRGQVIDTFITSLEWVSGAVGFGDGGWGRLRGGDGEGGVNGGDGGMRVGSPYIHSIDWSAGGSRVQGLARRLAIIITGKIDINLLTSTPYVSVEVHASLGMMQAGYRKKEK